MSEGLITLQEPSSPTKNLRAILRTVGINQVYDEVVEIARPSDGTTVDPTQIRALTATDIVTANIGGNFDGAGKLLVSPAAAIANYGSSGWSGAASVGWARSW